MKKKKVCFEEAKVNVLKEKKKPFHDGVNDVKSFIYLKYDFMDNNFCIYF